MKTMFKRYFLFSLTLSCLTSNISKFVSGNKTVNTDLQIELQNHTESDSHTESNNHTKSDDIDIREMLKEEGIIPGVIEDCPNKLCTVIYRDKKMEPGQYLFDTRTPFEPKITWEADENKFYTLYMCGSSITRPKYPMVTKTQNSKELVEWENWVVVNIPGCNVEKGNTVADYLSPRLEGDKERFVFLIYEQPRNFSFRAVQVKNDLEFPDSFRVIDFVKLHNLSGPVAVNYFVMDSITIPAPK